MAPFIQGNLAVQEKKRQQSRVQYRETTRVVYRKKGITVQEKLLYLFLIAACVVVAGTIIFRYAQIYDMNLKVQKMEGQINQIEAENKNLQLEVAKLSRASRLIEEGQKLGLKLPESDKDIKTITPKNTAEDDLAMNR